MRIWVVNDDLQRIDVTEGVQVLWDCTAAILAGSGLFDSAELQALIKLGEAAGFEKDSIR